MTWREDARTFAAAVAEWAAVEPTENDLTDRLIEFVFDPVNEDAAGISLLVSESEVIFGAGRGTRAELDGLPTSAEEVEWLVKGVVAGGLRETVKRRSVRWILQLADGTERIGKTSYLSGSLPAPHGVIDYGPYRSSP